MGTLGNTEQTPKLTPTHKAATRILAADAHGPGGAKPVTLVPQEVLGWGCFPPQGTILSKLTDKTRHTLLFPKHLHSMKTQAVVKFHQNTLCVHPKDSAWSLGD